MVNYQKIFLSIALIVCTLSLQSQSFTKGSITLNNNEVIKGKILVSSESQIIKTKGDNTSSSYNFNQISQYTVKDRTFVKIDFGETSFFAHELISGKASLFQIERNKFLISKDDGIFKEINSNSNDLIVRGVLSVLFEDCNSIRESIQKTHSISETSLKSLVNEYNACVYGEYTPTEDEISKANNFNTDEYKFFVGAGVGIRNVSFFNLNSSENMSQFGFKLGVAATPSFLGNLKGNLYFNMEVSAHFGSEKDFSNSISPTSFTVNTYRLIFSTDYYFNKKGKLKPYFGVGIGMSGDYFEGNVAGNEFDINGGNPIWMPKAGIMYTLNNGKDISLTFDYIPEYDNDLSFPVGDEIIPLDVNSSYINIGLNYYF